MGRSKRGSSKAGMERVRQQIDQWRKTRVNRGRMPEPLWRAAVALARQHGVYATARGLGVNYDSLKARAGAVGKPRKGPASKFVKARAGAVGKPRKGPASKFVEVSGGLPFGPAPAGWVVELAGPSGEKLVIRLASAEGSELDVAELCRDFWRRAG